MHSSWCYRMRAVAQYYPRSIQHLLSQSTQSNQFGLCPNSFFSSQSTQTDQDEFDIIINGGGIVGLTFLLGLQKSPFLKDKKILLLERQLPVAKSTTSDNSIESSTSTKTFSNRVSSLTESSRQFFDHIGLWPSLSEHSKRIDRMHVWSYDFNKAIRFRNVVDHSLDFRGLLSSKFAKPADDFVCYIAENDHILKALNENIRQEQIAYATEVRQITADQNLVRLHIQDDRTLTTKLLIGCDGFNSLVRSSCSFTQRSQKLDQMGIVGTIQMDPNTINSNNSISYQRFLPQLQSVLALLPLDETHCSFVLSTTRTQCQRWMTMTDEEFVDQMNELLHTHLSYNNNKELAKSIVNQLDQLVSFLLPKSITHSKSYSVPPTVSALQTGSRAAFPLGFATTLPNLVGSVHGNSFVNVALIGDSAHRIHPLAGQGLNLGIGDAEILCSSLENAASRGEALFGNARDPLQNEALQTSLLHFERERLVKLFCILSAVQSMTCLFEYTTPQMLQLFDQLGFVKQQIVQFANRS